MNKVSTISQNAQFQTCSVIKAKFDNSMTNKSEDERSSASNTFNGEATIVSIFKNQIGRSHEVKLSYTIKEGDNKRLKRDGVLRVYNMKEPIDIPVHKLLGKLRNTHVGTTLYYANNEWQVEGGLVEHVTPPFKLQLWQWITKHLVA